MVSVLAFSGDVGKRAAGCSPSVSSKAVVGFSEPGLVGARELPWEILVPDVQIFCRGPGWDLREALNMNTWKQAILLWYRHNLGLVPPLQKRDYGGAGNISGHLS